MKIVSIVGARPQFIKASPVSAALRQANEEILVHTGQHYDETMSAVFFDEMGIPQPDYNLGVGSGTHGSQTGQMLSGLEAIMLEHQPDWVLVYGDTNSTLAGALAAAKLNIPLAHVEAGLRSFDRTMPEEVNRVLTDHCSQLLFCPTQTAVQNLDQEGIQEGVHEVGDVMYDAMLNFLPRVEETAVLNRYDLHADEYILATIHRPSNTDTSDQLAQTLRCLTVAEWPVILPAHPRTVAALNRFQMSVPEGVTLIEPVSYLHMLALLKNARYILTDSGGVQKEAFWLSVPCITLREETEWVETVKAGWNYIVGTHIGKVQDALSQPRPVNAPPPIYGDGTTAGTISRLLTTGGMSG